MLTCEVARLDDSRAGFLRHLTDEGLLKLLARLDRPARQGPEPTLKFDEENISAAWA